MDVRTLDRLVSKTELNPTSKMLLKVVRKSVMKGKVKGPLMSDYHWTVLVQDFGGQSAKMTFKLKQEPHDPSQ